MSFSVTLVVGGDTISAFDISEILIREEFTKARRFEIQVLDEARAAWALDEVVRVDYGFASPKTLIGRVDAIDKRGGLAIITGRDVSYETLDRRVDKEYTDTEAVAIMKDLIDTYAAGVLTYANAAASATTIATMNPTRISMLDAFNKIIYFAESVDGDDFLWYLDHNKDLHTFAEGDVDSGRSLEWMIEIFDYRRIRDSWRAYDKVTVYGGLDGAGVATSGSAGAGSREKIVIDEFLSTDVACSQRAVAELKKTQGRSVYALTCVFSEDGPTIGERVFVELDPENVEMAFIVYAVEDYLYSGVTVVELGESVEGITDSMIDENVLDDYMKQIKPAATTALEGDYTAWTYVWGRAYVIGSWFLNVLVDNSGTVYTEDLSDSVYVVTRDEVETHVDDYIFFMFEWPFSDPMSATGKYMLGNPIYSTVFEVWKDGVQTFSRDVELDFGVVHEVYAFSISPNGKYVAIIYGDDNLLLYEGS